MDWMANMKRISDMKHLTHLDRIAMYSYAQCADQKDFNEVMSKLVQWNGMVTVLIDKHHK